MRGRQILAGLAGAGASVCVLFGVFALEVVLFLNSPTRSGGPQISVGWDPISLWHESASGNVPVIMLLLRVVLLIILPPMMAVVAGKYVYRRILRRFAQS